MKKNNIKKVGLVLLVISLIVGGYLVYHYYSRLRFEQINIERSADNCDDNCLSISLTFLRSKGGGEFSANFNKEMELQIANFLLSNTDSLQMEGISIDEALDSLIKDYNNMHELFPELPAYEYMVSDSIMWQNSKMLSVVSNRYSFTGEANPLQQKVFTHFSLENGEVITNENLFTDDEKVRKIAETYFKGAEEQYPIRPLNDKGFWFEGGVFQLPKNMGVAADALILYYEPFEIAPYMDVPFEVKVPIKEILPYLTFSDTK